MTRDGIPGMVYVSRPNGVVFVPDDEEKASRCICSPSEWMRSRRTDDVVRGCLALHGYTVNDAERKLQEFERDLERRGVGDAPNGATYKLCPFGPSDRPACERLTPAPDGNYEREIIVGFSGHAFDTWDQVRLWALADGRAELPSRPGQALSERKQIA